MLPHALLARPLTHTLPFPCTHIRHSRNNYYCSSINGMILGHDHIYVYMCVCVIGYWYRYRPLGDVSYLYRLKEKVCVSP